MNFTQTQTFTPDGDPGFKQWDIFENIFLKYVYIKYNMS
jgi:hypothetical protein